MARPEPTPPSIPDHTLLQRIGSGSYGDVWLARGITGLYRAVKIVHRAHFRDDSPFEREFLGLKRFARISLAETSQLAVLHIGRSPDDSFFYYIMELADDVHTRQEIDPANYTPYTLRERMAKGQGIPVAECLPLGINLAKALHTLHAQGLVHRDVKPSNVILVNGIPKLADIGLVATANQELSIVGTEGYIAPEGPGLPPADIFALGKLLYELATGLDRREFPRLPADLPNRPDRTELLELNEVLLRACDPSAARRYQTVEALQQELLLIQAGKSVRRLHLAEKSLRRAARWSLLLAVIAAIGLGGAYLERQRANASERLLEYSAMLTQTIGALQRGDFASARSQLQEATQNLPSQDSPSFEWRALHHLAQGDQSAIWRDSGPAIKSIQSAADASFVAIHDASTQVTLLDPQSGQATRTFPDITQFAGITPDHRYLFGTDASYQPARWQIDAPDSPPQIAPEATFCWPLGLSDSGTFTAIVPAPQLHLLNWNPSQNLHQSIAVDFTHAPQTKWEFFRGASGPTGQVAIAWVSLQEIKPQFLLTTWTASQGYVHTPVPQRPSAVGIDDQGPWAAMDLSGAEYRAQTDGTFAPSQRKLPPRTIARQQIAPDIEIVAHDQNLSWYDTPSGQRIRTAKGHPSQIKSFAAIGETIYSGSSSGDLRKWTPLSIDQSQPSYQAWNSNAYATSFVYTDDQHIAISKDGINSAIINTATLQETDIIKNIRTPIAYDNKTLIGEGESGYIMATGENYFLQQKFGNDRYLQSIYAPKSQRYFTIDQNNDLTLLQPNQPQQTLAQDWKFNYSLQTNPSGTLIWYVSNDNTLACFDLTFKTQKWKTTLSALSPTIILSKNSQYIYLVTLDGKIEIRDPQTGDLLLSSTAGNTTPETIALSSQEDRLFVGGRDGDVQVFNAQDLRFLCTLPLPQKEPIHYIASSPQDTSLAILSKSGLLQILQAPKQK